MPRILPNRRIPRHHLMPYRPSRRRTHGSDAKPVRASDLVLALLGVVLLGGLALGAAFTLAAAATAP
ncbi:hypothetical protein [Methylorubrum aminovorans]